MAAPRTMEWLRRAAAAAVVLGAAAAFARPALAGAASAAPGAWAPATDRLRALAAAAAAIFEGNAAKNASVAEEVAARIELVEVAAERRRFQWNQPKPA